MKRSSQSTSKTLPFKNSSKLANAQVTSLKDYEKFYNLLLSSRTLERNKLSVQTLQTYIGHNRYEHNS